MGTQKEYHGNSATITFSADISLHRERAWVYQLEASTIGLTVTLPDATKLDTGYPIIQIVTTSGSSVFAVEDASGGTVIAATSAGKVYTFALFDKSTAAGSWEYGEWTLNSTGAPPAVIFPWTLGGGTSTMLKTPYKYDFVADSWSTGANDSTANMADPGGARVGGNGIVCNNLKDVEKLNPETWTVRTDSTADHSQCPGAELSSAEDRGYFFGSNVGADGAETWYFDESVNAWTQVTSMPGVKHKGAVGRNGTKFTLASGTASFAAFQTAHTVVYQYDQVGDSYSTKTAITIARVQFAGVNDESDNLICYCGTSRDSAAIIYDDVERYNVSGDSWTSLSVHPQGDMNDGGGTHVEANERNYLLTGALSGGGSTDHKKYYQHIPVSDAYTEKASHGAADGYVGTMHSNLSLTN